MKFNSTYLFAALIVLVIVLIAGAKYLKQNEPGQYDDFAKCIANSGIKFYGAFWCPHCAQQKQEFGNSVKYLPYVECSTPDQKDQTPICKEKGITSYPTWITATGTRLSGVQTFDQLAAATGCQAPSSGGTQSTDVGGQTQIPLTSGTQASGTQTTSTAGGQATSTSTSTVQVP